jgi:hypothetical protein
MNTLKIPNVYQALAQCEERPELLKLFQAAFRSQGWSGMIKDCFLPQSNSMSGSQAALLLSVSIQARTHLISPTDMANFDAAIQHAIAKWAELNRVNRASKILTDYFR